MNKIPVGRTIAQTYGFAFGRYFTLLGIVWLPMLASFALTFYLRAPMMAEMTATTHGALPMDPQFQRMNFLLQLINLVLMAIISVGITKEVLGISRGWRFFYAGFGAAELRVIVGYFALFLLFVVFVIGFVVVLVVLAMVGGAVAGGSPATRGGFALALVILGAGLWLFLIYTFVRLTFLFLPATVAERRIGIVRSWELTHGNFWRIFAIGIAVLLPLIAISLAFAIQVLGSDYVAFVMQHAKEPEVIQRHVMERVAVIYQNFPLIMAVGFFVNPVLYGLLISPASFAYRALIPAPVEVAPPAPQAPMEAAPPIPGPDVERAEDAPLPEEIQEAIAPENPEENP